MSLSKSTLRVPADRVTWYGAGEPPQPAQPGVYDQGITAGRRWANEVATFAELDVLEDELRQGRNAFRSGFWDGVRAALVEFGERVDVEPVPGVVARSAG